MNNVDLILKDKNTNFVIFKGIMNTVVRLSPLALYMGSVVAGLVFEMTKAVFMFMGFILVEIVCLIFLFIYKTVQNPQCALLKSNEKIFILPAPIPTSFGFFVAFQLADMQHKKIFQPIKVFVLIVFMFLVIWSRINTGCHSVLESIFASVIGMGLGFGYYSVIQKFYNDDSVDFFKKPTSTEIDNEKVKNDDVYDL
jgi:hypothetical protein